MIKVKILCALLRHPTIVPHFYYHDLKRPNGEVYGKKYDCTNPSWYECPCRKFYSSGGGKGRL